MRLESSIERIIGEVYELDRAGCVRELRSMPYLRLDFTDAFLDAMSLERLRHVLVAAVLQARRHTGGHTGGGPIDRGPDAVREDRGAAWRGE